MSGEGLKLLSKIGLNKQNTNLRLKHSDRETGRNVDHLYGNSGGENFPANDTDIGFLPFTKNFQKSLWKVNGTLFLENFCEGHLTR